MQNRLTVADHPGPFKGLVTAIAHRIPKNHPKRDFYTSLSGDDFITMFRSGQMTDVEHELICQNNTITEALENTAVRILLGTWTGGGAVSADESMHVKYLVLGTSAADPTDMAGGASTTKKTDTKLANELYRAVPTERIQGTGKKAQYTLYVGPLSGNPAGITTVDGGGTNDTTHVYLADATNFAIGDKIYVNTGVPNSYSTITDLVGQQATLDSNEPLPGNPVAGVAVKVVWAEIGIVGNENASLLADSGDLFGRVILQTPFEKDDETVITVEYQLIVAGT